MITPGEPAGIGPDICIKLVQQKVPASIVFVADPMLIEQRAEQLQHDIRLDIYHDDDDIPPHEAGHFPLIPVTAEKPVTSGELCRDNADYVLQTLSRALDLITWGNFDALVTGPVHKGIINDAGIAFTGHTEWLADQVSKAITSERLESVIRTLHRDLITKLHIANPRIRICGLNPHAGEGGHLGQEETSVIEPVIRRLAAEGMELTGPVPADTAFIPASLDKTDAILAMYHDQGLPVLKYSGFDHAVNITLGLPIIRTSVDHGTAMELAGTGEADASSLRAAVNMAVMMADHDE